MFLPLLEIVMFLLNILNILFLTRFNFKCCHTLAVAVKCESYNFTLTKHSSNDNFVYEFIMGC